MYDFWCNKSIAPAPSSEFASTGCHHVLYPFRLATVREGDDKTMGRSKDVHRGSVDPAGLATDVRENAEAGKPTCEQTGDPVRDSDVDLRQPSLAEPHHQDSASCDGED
jgi:hypothetical protein